MLEKVTVTNHLGETYDLPLRTPDESGFIIGSITGLNPPNANVNFTDSSTLDGGWYNSARVSRRNIVFTLIYLPRASIEECRHKSYRVFPIKKKVKLTFTTDERVLITEGYVETNEATVFSQNAGTRISVLCPKPFFEANSSVELGFGTITSMFEFPFSNEDLNLPLIEFSGYSSDHEIHIEYTGELEVGVTFTLDFNGPVGDISIGDADGHLMFLDVSRIEDNTGTAIGAGDRIVISTMPGEKSITLIRLGYSIPIYYCIDRYFEWLELRPGTNVMYYQAVSGVDNIKLTLSYPIYYQGM